MASDFHDPNFHDYDPMEIDPPTPHLTTLPPELRTKIWTTTLPSLPARTIELTTSTSIFTLPSGEHLTIPNRVCAKAAPVPPIFHICYESRFQAAKHYSSAFTHLLDNGPIFFDFSKDTLLFDSLGTYQNFVRTHACQLRALVEDATVVAKAICEFHERIKFMAIKDCITSHSDDELAGLWRLEKLTFLNDKFRFWPGFREDFVEALAPRVVWSRAQRARNVVTHERDLIDAWLYAEAKANGDKVLVGRVREIEYADFYDLRVKMG